MGHRCSPSRKSTQKRHTQKLSVLPLLGHTDRATLTASGLRVLATHTKAPVVAEATVAPHPLEALEILTQLLFENVGVGLNVLAVLDVLLSVEEPIGDLELSRVLDDGEDLVNLIVGKLTGSGRGPKNA